MNTVGRSISRLLVALSPGIGAAPGAYATVTLAAPSCGYLITEIGTLYPDASNWLRDVIVAGAVVWLVWIVSFLRAPRWREATSWSSVSGRLATVASVVGGVAIGVVISLIAYAAVAGVDDFCDYVFFPIVLIRTLVFLVPLFLTYLVIEVIVDVKRRKHAK